MKDKKVGHGRSDAPTQRTGANGIDYKEQDNGDHLVEVLDRIKSSAGYAFQNVDQVSLKSTNTTQYAFNSQSGANSATSQESISQYNANTMLRNGPLSFYSDPSQHDHCVLPDLEWGLESPPPPSTSLSSSKKSSITTGSLHNSFDFAGKNKPTPSPSSISSSVSSSSTFTSTSTSYTSKNHSLQSNSTDNCDNLSKDNKSSPKSCGSNSYSSKTVEQMKISQFVQAKSVNILREFLEDPSNRFISENPDVEDKFWSDFTCLMFQSRNGDVERVKYLLVKFFGKINMNKMTSPDNNGSRFNAIICAICAENPDTLALLLAAGANPTIKCGKFGLPIDYAFSAHNSSEGGKRCIQLLMSYNGKGMSSDFSIRLSNWVYEEEQIMITRRKYKALQDGSKYLDTSSRTIYKDDKKMGSFDNDGEKLEITQYERDHYCKEGGRSDLKSTINNQNDSSISVEVESKNPARARPPRASIHLEAGRKAMLPKFERKNYTITTDCSTLTETQLQNIEKFSFENHYGSITLQFCDVRYKDFDQLVDIIEFERPIFKVGFPLCLRNTCKLFNMPWYEDYNQYYEIWCLRRGLSYLSYSPEMLTLTFEDLTIIKKRTTTSSKLPVHAVFLG